VSGTWSRFVDRPRTVAARRWLFQVHMYLGLFLGAYFAAIGLTGSALVFRPEVERSIVLRNRAPAPARSSVGPLDAAWNNVRRQYPGQAIEAFSMNQYPGARPGDPYRVRVRSPGRTTFVYVDSSTGQVLGSQHPAIVWLQDLHFNLFGGRTGLMLNGAGAVLFVVMCVTGLVVWWPGRRNWRRGFTVRWDARWQGINYDVHSVLGVAAMALLGVVAAAGVYVVVQMLDAPDAQQLAWQASVNSFSVDLDEIVGRAETVAPDGIRVGLYLPSAPNAPFRFDKLVGGTPVKVFLDQRSGEIVRVDRTRDRSFGTWLAQATGDIHYGRSLGNVNRSVWVILGVVPSILFVSGVLMWWNTTWSKRRG
jgi:uncharacterized iron-regulated membrane protein